MDTITIFRFGYEGWGNHTRELVQAADAVETSRGFSSPCFVDIRIRRAVRAAGFVNNNFGALLGDRYRWMKQLGNRRILEGAPGIQIDDPSAADELLSIAVTTAEHRQRCICFCSCKWPKIDGEIFCHRAAVDAPLFDAARRRGISLAVEEWPGGGPTRLELEVPKSLLQTVRRGARKSIPVTVTESPGELGRLAGVGWASTAQLRAGDVEPVDVLVGPAQYATTGWQLPVLEALHASASDASRRWREAHGC